MPEVKIGNFSIVDHCIIDEHANIGDYSYIGFGDTHMDGSIMTILGKSSIIPSGTVIGRNCRILPDVRLEDFTSGCFVPSCRIIGQSISLESTIRV